MKIGPLRNTVSALLFLVVTSAQGNELTNSTFDSDISSWDDSFFGPPANRAEWIAEDGGPISGAGCLEEGTTNNNFGVNGLFQELPTAEGESYILSGWSRVPSETPENGASLAASWIDDMGEVISTTGDTFNYDFGGGWHPHYSVVTAPAGAVVVRVRPSVATVESGIVESVARWDDLSLTSALVFSDGFELGTTDHWSSTVP